MTLSNLNSSNGKRVALYLQDKHPIRDGMDYVRYAEEKGFEAVWQAESRLVRDAIVPMAAFAAVTDRIQVGSGVINNWTRNIGLLAATFLTLDDLAPNRVICGIGAWWDPLARNVGIDRRKPLTAMRETIEVMRRLLAMENVTYHGEFHHVDGIELDVVHGRREPRHVPMMIGATGPQMMELTGEIADGAVLNYCVPPEYNIHALEQLEKGAAKTGRTLADIDRPQLIVCSVHEDRKTALDERVNCSRNTWHSSRTLPRPVALNRRRWIRSKPFWAGLPPSSKCVKPCRWCQMNWYSVLRPAARLPRSKPKCVSMWTMGPPALFSIPWAMSR